MVAENKGRQKVRLLAKDPYILFVPVSVLMRHHGVAYPTAREAIVLAEQTARADPDRWDRIQKRRVRDQLVSTVRVAEESYPGIALKCVRVQNFAATSTEYKITRERVRQIHAAIERLADMLEKTAVQIAVLAEQGKLPSTQRDKFLAENAEPAVSE